MPDENLDVNADSSTATDVQADSSTAAPVEATTTKAEPDQAVPYDRFKEVAEEKNYWREQAMLANQRQQQPVQAEADPYANMDAQTKVFYQEMDKRAEKIAERKFAEKEKEYKATLDHLAMQNAKVQEKLFRNEQKDVLPGSREESEIANLIRMGLDPEKAAWAVMGPKRVESAGSTKQVKQQVKTQEKAQANLETASIPANHGIPQKEVLSFRDRLAGKMKEAGI